MESLIPLLQERDLSIGQDELRRTSESTETQVALALWTQRCISEETVLSPDEYQLWQKLKTRKQPQSDIYARPVTDENIQTAIASLQSSTAAIEKQQQVLERQKDALLKLRRRNETRHVGNAPQPSPQNPEATHMDYAVVELQQSLEEDFGAIGEHVASTLRSVICYATERLDADDKSLEAITRLRLGDDPQVSTPDAKSVEQWCNALTAFRTSEVRAAIDETLNNELRHATAGATRNTTDNANDDELRALHAELDTLRAEIASVTEMVVDHEYRKPILSGIERSKMSTIQSRKAWFDYISTSLLYIKNRANVLGRTVLELRSFHEALAEVGTILAPQIRQLQSEPVSSPKLERTTSGLRPLLLGRSTSGTVDPENPARLLRMLDAEIEVDKEPMTKRRLQKIVYSRLVKSDAQRTLAESSNLHVLGGYLSKETAEGDAVYNALHANSEFNERQLEDPTIAKQLEAFETAIDQLGGGISDIESVLRAPLPTGAQKLLRKYN